jgi:mono/diheme cytochrome c family protein
VFETLYALLANLGYTHPLHPPLTHVPLGMVIGAFVFGTLALWRKHWQLALTARHCAILALCGFFPTVLLGLADWQHFYQGAMLFEIKAKLALAAVLLAVLLVSVGLSRGSDPWARGVLGTYALSLVLAGALGYFGGELVFRGRAVPAAATVSPLVGEGEAIFRQNCSACHLPASTEVKFGPGLKGLFKQDRMASTGGPVTEEAVRRQIQTPAKMMPPFPSFTPEQMDALIAYLKSL